MTDAGADVAEFFARQQQDGHYKSLKAMTAEVDRTAAGVLNERSRGDVLSVGGVWDYFQPGQAIESLTVLDLSAEMLEAYCPDGASAVHGDVYTKSFPTASFDTIVFPLMLHHTAEGNWTRCEARVAEALDRAATWLRPDGRVIILECCPQPVWQLAQRVMLPVTRRILARSGQPLVAMHPRRFYERLLRQRFGTASSVRIVAPGFDYWTWYPVFMSSRWLRVPYALYPRMHVIST